jgi:hypothetical protein
MATGTGIFTTIPGTSVMVALTDESNYYMLIKCTVVNIPAATSGYGKGCICIATDSGALYTNQGTSSSCSFVVLT